MNVKKLAGKVFLLSGIAAGLLGGVAHASGSAYVIKGVGVSACPEKSLCLYADVDYNQGKVRTKILVIPSGSRAGDFAEYGFDHSGDGVSAVYNNTSHKTGIISGMHLTGEVLHINPGQQINNLIKYPLGSGNWNDAAKSAISAPVLRSSMQLQMRGPGSVEAGKKIAYTIDVKNGGPSSVDDGRVNISLPTQLDRLSVKCTAEKMQNAGYCQRVKLPKTWCYPKMGVC